DEEEHDGAQPGLQLKDAGEAEREDRPSGRRVFLAVDTEPDGDGCADEKDRCDGERVLLGPRALDDDRRHALSLRGGSGGNVHPAHFHRGLFDQSPCRKADAGLRPWAAGSSTIAASPPSSAAARTSEPWSTDSSRSAIARPSPVPPVP